MLPPHPTATRDRLLSTGPAAPKLITGRRPATRSKGKPVGSCELRIELPALRPVIWRRLRVREDIRLSLLHAILQVAMGWTNSHLHRFTVGEIGYTDLATVDEPFPGQKPDRDEERMQLDTALLQGATELNYEYDFGDSWHHVITVQRVHEHAPAFTKIAVCLGGACACPPEDCGGPPGYARLLKILKNPRHEEHKSMLDWLGGRFDPKAFAIARVNQALGRLKFPRTTESQLRRALMERDGVKA